MHIEKYLSRYHYLHELIKKESTGTALQFSQKLGISRRMLFEYLSDLREKGAPIEFCRRRMTYYYKGSWGLTDHLPILHQAEIALV